MHHRVTLCALVLGILGLPATGLGQNTTFGTSVHLLVGQTPVRVAPATTSEQRFYDAPVVQSRSYCAEATPSESELNPATPTLTVYRQDQATTLGVEGAALEPKGLAASRICFIAPGTENVFVRLETSANGREYTLRFLETTLWANWFFVGGEYSSYTLLRNTTNQALSVNLRWRADTGAEVGTRLGQTVPANGVIYIDTRTVLNCAGTPCSTLAGSVEVAHTGSPEAIVGSQTTLSGGTGLSFDTLLFQRRVW